MSKSVYNKDVLKKYTKSPRVEPGWYAVCLQAVSPQENQRNNCVQYRFEWKILENEADSSSTIGPAISQFLAWTCMPDGVVFEEEDHKRNGWDAPKVASILNLRYPSKVPGVPYRDGRECKNGEGDLIDRDEMETLKDEAIDCAVPVAAQLYDESNIESLTGIVGYARIGYRKGSDFPNIEAITSARPVEVRTRPYA